MTLNGQVAFVTGGSRGIGLAIARALLAQGVHVAFTGTGSDGVARAVQELSSSAPAERVLGLTADVRRLSDVETAVAATVERFGRLDILINNAGVGRFVPLSEMSVDEWNDVIGTNLTGVFHCCRTALPWLRVQGGAIINISSLAASNPFVNGTAYCASKAALNAFSEALMQEVRYDGIRVAYVMPGSVDTGFGGRGAGKEGWALIPDDVAEAVCHVLQHPSRSLPSRIEIRPSRPPRKG